MKIRMREQIGVGNFGEHADGTQETAANNFSRIIEERLTEYCNENYPDAELKFDLSVENVSGCCTQFSCSCDTVYSYPDSWGDCGKYLSEDDFDNYVKSMQDECSDESSSIENEIESEYKSICDELEHSGKIYE